ncbi:MAG TPA: SDR family oxidoreductase [Kofleriaceae bacterium]|nr:SDR family oxidoreductase [Kofleriaceae bacterium]
MDLGLSGKRVVVTGSSRGIGRAIAVALGREGARVALCARGPDALEAAAADVRAAGGEALALTADVTTEAGVAAVSDGALAAFGGVDILVNNVGGSGARTFDATDDADLRAILDRNLWPAFRLSRALVPQMKARRDGVILMITSVWGREAGGGPSYNVAKAAEMSLAKAMARDLARDGIRVNSLAPGSVLFPGGGWDRRQKADPAGIAAFVERELPFGRFGTPEEIADVVAFAVSPRASWISGACISVDGCQSRAF